jgi:hypothetical protein
MGDKTPTSNIEEVHRGVARRRRAALVPANTQHEHIQPGDKSLCNRGCNLEAWNAKRQAQRACPKKRRRKKKKKIYPRKEPSLFSWNQRGRKVLMYSPVLCQMARKEHQGTDLASAASPASRQQRLAAATP